MDARAQIKSIKSQIDIIKLQIDSLESQNDNPVETRELGEKLVSLSLQLFNAGIESFNYGKQLINLLYPEGLYQHLMLFEQNLQQIMYQPQIIMEQMQRRQMMRQYEEFEKTYIKFIFRRVDGYICKIKQKKGTTVKDLLNTYINQIPEPLSSDREFIFVFNASIIRINDQRKIEDVFPSSNSLIGIVVNIGYRIISNSSNISN